MENMVSVAQELDALYETDNGKNMPLSRLQRLMYLVQRESLLKTKEQLFENEFWGTKHGPALKELRNGLPKEKQEPLTGKSEDLVRSVYERYKKTSDWNLATLVTCEYSWLSSRQGLKPDADATRTLRHCDMLMDALKEKYRRPEERKQTEKES